MKILSVTLTISKKDAQWTRISNMFHLLEKSGAKISLVHYVIKGGNSYQNIKNNIEKAPSDKVFIYNPLTLLFKHLIILIKGEYDLVFGNTYVGAFFCILGKLMKKPLILDMHGISEELALYENFRVRSLIMGLTEKIALLSSDKILCVSHEMINYLHSQKKVPIKKLFYVPNGVDLDFFKQVDDDVVHELKKIHKIEDKLIFGYIGGTQKVQGVDKFVSACKEINNEKFIAVIVGCNISEIIYEDNIIYVPYVERNEIVKYYSLCDIFVLPRPNDIVTRVAAPTKFVEYLSMGKPILVTDVGDASTLVKKCNNGIVIANNEIENIKKGINDFLELRKDKINQMGLNSRKLAEKEFDWNNIRNLLSAVLNDYS